MGRGVSRNVSRGGKGSRSDCLSYEVGGLKGRQGLSGVKIF